MTFPSCFPVSSSQTHATFDFNSTPFVSQTYFTTRGQHKAMHSTLTPSQYKEVVPLLCRFSKHSHHKQIKHDALSQHPTEHTQKEVVKQGCYGSAEPLREKSTKYFKFSSQAVTLCSYYSRYINKEGGPHEEVGQQ